MGFSVRHPSRGDPTTQTSLLDDWSETPVSPDSRDRCRGDTTGSTLCGIPYFVRKKVESGNPFPDEVGLDTRCRVVPTGHSGASDTRRAEVLSVGNPPVLWSPQDTSTSFVTGPSSRLQEVKKIDFTTFREVDETRCS